MPQYIYSNIIIRTIIISKKNSARFLHTAALPPFYLFQHELEHKKKKS